MNEQIKARVEELKRIMKTMETITTELGTFVVEVQLSAGAEELEWKPEPGNLMYHINHHGVLDSIKATNPLHQKELTLHCYPTRAEAVIADSEQIIMKRLKYAADKLNGEWKPSIADSGHAIGMYEGKFQVWVKTSTLPAAGEVRFKSFDAAKRAILLLGDDLMYLFHHRESK